MVVVQAALGPAARPLRRMEGVVVVRRVRDALVEGHGDIRIKGHLHVHRYFRRQEFLRAVQMRAEGYAFFRNLAHLPQAEYLKSAAVRQDSLLPVHKLVQAAGFLDQVFAGPQEQVIRIAQDDLGAHVVQLFRRQGLDRRLRAYGHKHRRLEGSVRSAQDAGSGAVAFGLQFVSNNQRRVLLSYKHGVAEAEETVFFLHGNFIRL